jgi:IclR family acetate operon transcriptional repressor
MSAKTGSARAVPRPRPRPKFLTPSGRSAAGAGHTQALSRGLAVLEALAATEGGATLTAIAETLALPVPTVYRLLSTLSELGYVQQGAAGEWLMGVRAFRVGAAFLDHRNLVVQAYPFLKRLMEASGETTNLAVIDGFEAVFVEQVQCRELMRMSTKLGARAPLHASGVGKAMLAAMDPRAAESALGRGALPQHTAKTITDRRALVRELVVTRERGYALDDEEHAEGLFCVAAPLWDENGEPWAAISLAGPTSRIVPARVAELGALVCGTAADLTVALGGHRPRRAAR